MRNKNVDECYTDFSNKKVQNVIKKKKEKKNVAVFPEETVGKFVRVIENSWFHVQNFGLGSERCPLSQKEIIQSVLIDCKWQPEGMISLLKTSLKTIIIVHNFN